MSPVVSKPTREVNPEAFIALYEEYRVLYRKLQSLKLDNGLIEAASAWIERANEVRISHPEVNDKVSHLIARLIVVCPEIP
jgi:hypothetical protein